MSRIVPTKYLLDSTYPANSLADRRLVGFDEQLKLRSGGSIHVSLHFPSSSTRIETLGEVNMRSIEVEWLRQAILFCDHQAWLLRSHKEAGINVDAIRGTETTFISVLSSRNDASS